MAIANAVENPSSSAEANGHWDIRENHKLLEDVTIIYLPGWAQAVLTAGNILVLIAAFCGNVAAIIVVLRSRLSKMSTRCFLVTLALSDLILAGMSMPIDIGKLMDKYHSWVFGTLMCEIVAAVQTHFFMINAFCLFAISLERYLTVVRSIKTSHLSPAWEARLPYILLALTWLTPFACSIPMLHGYEEWSFWVLTKISETSYRFVANQTFYLCQHTSEFSQNAVWYVSVGAIFFTLLIAFLFCYLSIILFVKTHGNNFPRRQQQHGQNSGSQDRSSASSNEGTLNGRQRRTVRLIMGLIIIFVVCRVPNWIFLIILTLDPTIGKNRTMTTTIARYFLHLLGNINTALSPFVYAIWNDSLRTTDGTNDEQNSFCWCGCTDGVFNNDNFGKIFQFGKGNGYDFTTQSKAVQSNSTEKFNLSVKNLPSLISSSSNKINVPE